MAEQVVNGSEQGIGELSQIAKVTAIALSKAIGSEDFADRLTLAIDTLDDEAQLRFLSRGLSMAVVVLRDVELPPKTLPEPKIIEMPAWVAPVAIVRPAIRAQESPAPEAVEVPEIEQEPAKEPILASKPVRTFFANAFQTSAAEQITEDQVPALLETLRSLYMPINPQPKTAAKNMERLKLFAAGKSDEEIIEALGEHVAPNSIYKNRGWIIKLLRRGYTAEELANSFTATVADGRTHMVEPTVKGENYEFAPANALAVRFFTRIFNQDKLLAGITNAQASELYEQVASTYMALNRKQGAARKQAERLRLTVAGLTDTKIAELDASGDTTATAVYIGRTRLIEIVQRGRTEAELAEILREVLHKGTLLLPELENTTTY